METYIVKVPVTGKAEAVPFNAADSYSQLRDAVGGYIEAAITPAIPTTENYSIDCYVDEEGLLKQLPLNGRLTAFARPVYNLPLVGNAVFAAHDAEGETVGLSKADADAIVARFNMDKTYIVNCPVEGEATVVGFDAAAPNKQLCDLIKTSTVRRGKKQPFFCRGFDNLMLWEDDRHFDKRYPHGKSLLYNRKAEEFLTMTEMGNVVFSHVGKDGLPDGMPEYKAKAIASLLNIDPNAEREAMIKADNAAADAEGEITDAVRQKWFRNYGTCNGWDNERRRLFRIASILHDRDMEVHPELHQVHQLNTVRGWHETACTCGYRHSCDSSD